MNRQRLLFQKKEEEETRTKRYVDATFNVLSYKFFGWEKENLKN